MNTQKLFKVRNVPARYKLRTGTDFNKDKLFCQYILSIYCILPSLLLIISVNFIIFLLFFYKKGPLWASIKMS